jgi:hypothetical protein
MAALLFGWMSINIIMIIAIIIEIKITIVAAVVGTGRLLSQLAASTDGLEDLCRGRRSGGRGRGRGRGG